jgi:hypothetical protein
MKFLIMQFLPSPVTSSVIVSSKYFIYHFIPKRPKMSSSLQWETNF